MSYRTIPNWPPVWIERYGDNQIISGEVGVLTHVGVYPESKRCYLYITHKGIPYLGSLLFDDVAVCRTVALLLKDHVGSPIWEIGDLDISHKL
jgi:hypothetical protein